MAMCEDVKYLSRGINVVGIVERKCEPKIANTKYGPQKCCLVFLRDETDVLRLTLWQGDINKIKNGDRIEVKNGYTTTYNGNRYLSAGFYGSIHILSNKVEQPKKLSKHSTNLPSEDDLGITIIDEQDYGEIHTLAERIKLDRQLWRESLA